jgi:hypothetical protein
LEVAAARLFTVVVVAANRNAIAVDRGSFETRAGGATALSWRAAERVGVSTARNLLDDGGWLRGWWWWWWWAAGVARSSNGTDSSNNEDGEDLRELHLDRR